MKNDIHPDYHMIKVQMTDGEVYETRSTQGKEGDLLKLDIDSKSHPTYTGGGAKVIEKGQLTKFEGKFAGFVAE